MFENLPSSSVPTIGKAFPGTIGTSTIPSLTCSETQIADQTRTAAQDTAAGQTDLTAAPTIECKSKKYFALIY